MCVCVERKYGMKTKLAASDRDIDRFLSVSCDSHAHVKVISIASQSPRHERLQRKKNRVSRVSFFRASASESDKPRSPRRRRTDEKGSTTGRSVQLRKAQLHPRNRSRGRSFRVMTRVICESGTAAREKAARPAGSKLSITGRAAIITGGWI